MVHELSQARLVGRSSSHFTRVARLFAAELGVAYSLDVLRDLMSEDAADYAGNPALKLPIWVTPAGTWFGSLNICRAMARAATRPLRMVWPEDLQTPLLGNAQELTSQAMATEVSLVLSKLAARGAPDDALQAKMRASLVSSLGWLDAHANEALAALPADRDLSYLEVTLYCLVTHLEFRSVVPVAPYPQLLRFCQAFGERASAQATTYRFDS